MITNSYGNFVVQKTLKLSQGRLKTILIIELVKVIGKIPDKKLIVRWKKIVYNNLPIESGNCINLQDLQLLNRCIAIMEGNFVNAESLNPYFIC